MNKRAAIALAVVVGLIAVALPIAASLYWAQKQSRDEEMAAAEALADEALRRTDLTQSQIYEAFRVLEQAKATDPCSEENIRLMRRLAVRLDQLKTVGYVANDHMVCSAYGRHDNNRPGIPMGPVTYRSTTGTLVRTSVQLALVPGMTFLASTSERSGYTALVQRGSPVLIFVDRKDVSIGVFSISAKRLIVSRGTFKPEWIEALRNRSEAKFIDRDYLVAIKLSAKYPVAAYAAIEKASVANLFSRLAMIVVPVGLAAGLLLAWAVLYVARQQLALPAVLKVALKRNEFFLLYQPIVDLRGGRCVGAEALIRWRRPNGELVRPDIFIPVAEETGLIHEVTKRVMEMVARDSTELLKLHPDLHLGINLSSQDLQLEDTPRLIQALILKMGVRPHNILLEATERGFMEANKAREIMGDIRALKFKIAIDDFGTGYSSLSYLEKFPLDYLKIDKSFVDTMGGQTATSQVALHIIEMAKSLKLEMIAEGVETAEQAVFLQEHGVQFAQGYFFGKPMPLAELATFIEKMNKLADR